MRLLKISLLTLLLAAAAWAQDPMLTAATAYLEAFSKATSWQDVLPHVSSESAQAIASLSPENRDRVFTFYQKLQQAVAGTGPMEVKERSVEGDRARLVLQVVGARPSDDFQGQNMNLIREGGQWKVDIAKLVRAMGS